ncbi:MAG: DUF4037 domain-containing protein [Actinocrinis sp.]
MDPHQRSFTPGLELSERFYREAVAPLLDRYFSGLPHTAARIGTGSEVLGFDTERSADHEWGPRLQLLLDDVSADQLAPRIGAMLADELPKTFLGYPTNFGGGDGDGSVLHMEPMEPDGGPVRHRVDIAGLGGWFTGHLGFDPRSATATVERGAAGAGEPESALVPVFDWLATPTQSLAEVTRGTVMHDGLGELTKVRARLAWYPTDVWRYVLASGWQRISQEEAFVGRTGEVGDELGSAVVAARLVRDLMRLALLMNRQYPPYGKWLGSAFSRSPEGERLTPVFRAALAATSWRDREKQLASAYEEIAAMQNRLGLCEPVDPTTRPYHDRPFQVLHAERFANALSSALTTEELRALPLVGTVDQYVDSVDALGDVTRRRAITRAALNGKGGGAG